ncbi:LuxR C-terminal-related transcriptional regulator [Brevibacillus fulvus]|uniref:DNA-binding NarL/FixJ family response regulator n=1 Tax=Brevibacillus fulvus TaxID=1125967 RepID=A0A939BUG9_9BACL|nr:response regulator transcription factor [Brevibacillus fulvus]MBM7589546.1 DNA-binding NarL/FixJ family response regulator [Brevibacillus fulvus]
MSKVMLISSKNYIWCQGIKLFISKLQSYSLVADLKFDDQVSERMDSLKPDIVMLDTGLIDLFGIDVLEQFSESPLPLPILLIGDLEQCEKIETLFHYGVKGYISSSCTEEQLLDALNTVNRNKEWIAPEVASRVLGRMSKRNRHQSIHFTQRELEILSLMVNGYNNTEIAEHLHISVYTIQNHISNIYAKIGLNERLKVVHYVIQNRIVNI